MMPINAQARISSFANCNARYSTVMTPASPMRAQGLGAAVSQQELLDEIASHTPMPSCTSTFIRLARRLANR